MATATRPAVTPTLPAYPGLPGRDYSPAYGGVPAVSNPLATTKEAIEGNVALLPDLKQLGRGANAQLFGQYTSRMPGYSDIAAQSSENIGSLMKGEIPADVLYQIGQQSAERGVGQGVGGSQFANSEYLRALGLTSLDLQQQGEKDFSGAMGRLKDVPFFDATKMFVSPEGMWNAAQQANIMGVAPSPGAAAAAGLQNTAKGLEDGMGNYKGPISVGGIPNLGSVSGTSPGKGSVVGGASTGYNNPVTDTYNPWTSGGWAGGSGAPGSQEGGYDFTNDPYGYFEGQPSIYDPVAGGMDTGGGYYPDLTGGWGSEF